MMEHLQAQSQHIAYPRVYEKPFRWAKHYVRQHLFEMPWDTRLLKVWKG